MQDCEFCAELSERSQRFKKVYGALASNRIVARTDRFVAIPTLGQLFAGSILLLPIDHVETCANLAPDARKELGELAEQMVAKVRQFGEPIQFEHGSTENRNGACGIYHAHLHIVPLPEMTLASTIFPEYSSSAADIQGAWECLQDSQEYLLVAAAGQTVYRDLSDSPKMFPSQFFRRRIVEHFRLGAPWDWRQYTEIEPALLRTLELGLPEHAQ